MENNLKQKYGLVTAIAMVVGIVIGSGVFFKAEKILVATGGNLPLGILSWVLGGIIMGSCAYAFSLLANRFSYVNGLVDYAEVSCGKKYAGMVGWFMALIYYPSLTSVLAWITARYTSVILGFDITGAECMVLSMFFLVSSYALNALSPILAGKFQVATTIIKLIPLLLMAVVGTVVGLANGLTVQNFTTVVDSSITTSTALFTAVVATSFAYEGWIIATSINAELKDAKKNLPRALISGAIIVVAVYILYYIGLAGGVTNEVMMQSGETGAKLAFESVFGSVGAILLFVFIVISCMGSLNGLMLASVRGIYALAVRDLGPNPKMFKQVDKVTDIPTNSSVLGLLLCGIWLLYFYGANLTASWFGFFTFDSSELPIVTIYAIYIPIFLWMFKDKELSTAKRVVVPTLAIAGCLFMIVAACFSHGMAVLSYLAVFVVIMIGGFCFINKAQKEG